MTTPFEFEEPELINASHLVRTVCRICGEAEALAVPEKADVAGCGPCLARRAGSGGVYEGKPVPVVRFGTYGVTLPPEVREAYPAPEVSSHTPWPLDMEVPSAVRSLREFACNENGWTVETAYSRGRMPHGSTGRPGALKHLISLRFGGHPMTDRQAYAVYSKSVTGAGTWSWSSVWIWGPDLPPFGMCGITELKAYLAEVCTDSPTSIGIWIGDIRQHMIGAELAKVWTDAARKTIKKAYDAVTLPSAGPARVLAALGWLGRISWEYRVTFEEIEAIVNKVVKAKRESGG